jgi:hypothetical protein
MNNHELVQQALEYSADLWIAQMFRLNHQDMGDHAGNVFTNLLSNRTLSALSQAEISALKRSFKEEFIAAGNAEIIVYPNTTVLYSGVDYNPDGFLYHTCKMLRLKGITVIEFLLPVKSSVNINLKEDSVSVNYRFGYQSEWQAKTFMNENCESK